MKQKEDPADLILMIVKSIFLLFTLLILGGVLTTILSQHSPESKEKVNSAMPQP
ncbi:MAG TPA: hypothetical protein V6D19_12635 [Stenomitos sp.]